MALQPWAAGDEHWIHFQQGVMAQRLLRHGFSLAGAADFG